MLHPQEMVLPAGIANQMRSVIGGGGSGGSGVTVVVNHSVSAVDAASFQGHIRRHGNMIANEVTRALKRKGVR
jgi:ABC-type phosphate transport system ATPase subunit